MKLFIDSDHNGFELKETLVDYLKRSGFEVVDVGAEKLDPNDDFPHAAARVVNAMFGSDPHADRGILICGSGQGVCMAANRFKGIRASLCWDNREARAARNDDDSNVLCLPARMLSEDVAKSVLHVWLDTAFAGAPRYKRRIAQLDELG